MGVQLHTLYPNYIMTLDSLLTPEKNAVLAELAWGMAIKNEKKDKIFSTRTTEFHSTRPECLFEVYSHIPEVSELAKLSDGIARLFLKSAYGYTSEDPINLLAETFCQNESTGRSGMVMHTHHAPINVVYYPRVNINKVSEASAGRAGRNGEIDFFNPTGQPKKPWPALMMGHHHGSIFRLSPKSGMAVCFEGYMPHCAAQFDGDERVVIAISCKPKMAGQNDGLTLKELHL